MDPVATDQSLNQGISQTLGAEGEAPETPALAAETGDNPFNSLLEEWKAEGLQPDEIKNRLDAFNRLNGPEGEKFLDEQVSQRLEGGLRAEIRKEAYSDLFSSEGGIQRTIELLQKIGAIPQGDPLTAASGYEDDANPQIQQLTRSIAALKHKIGELEGSTTGLATETSGNFESIRMDNEFSSAATRFPASPKIQKAISDEIMERRSDVPGSFKRPGSVVEFYQKRLKHYQALAPEFFQKSRTGGILPARGGGPGPAKKDTSKLSSDELNKSITADFGALLDDAVG